VWWPTSLALLALVVAFLVGAANAPSSAIQEGGFLGASAGPSPAEALPNGFHDDVVFSGLTNPTAIRFAPDGRVFVAEKSGLVKVFDSLADQTPTVAVDLSTEVDDYWDRGLLGMALDPAYPASPYLYLLYTHDAPPGHTAPVWNDDCPTPPGPTTDGCVVTGKLVRVHLSGDTADQPPHTLIAGQWCQQYPSHSVGDLRFGPDGDLYVTGGEGASFNFADYGQGGGSDGSPTPLNPCGDPPAGVGGAETPPSALGGALRSQSPRRPAGPVLLNGAVLRLDPATGAARAGNPNAGSTDPNARRIIAYGLRNPFRMAFRPATNELWIGDVGWNSWEEINRRSSPTGPVQNFGWPCYEGSGPMQSYEDAGLSLCNALYAAGTATGPYYSYSHDAAVVPGDGCPTASGSVISGLTFYPGGDYPASYDGALVFADHSRNCIWAMGLGVGGDPDPATLQVLENGAANPVDVEPGPDGDLYYVDFDGGTIHRISYAPTNTCSASDYRADYYNNTSLAGDPVLTRCESAIDYSWGTGSPGPGVNADDFSARWTAGVSFAPGSYTFTATVDDGIRVFVDGSLLIDHWVDQASPATYTAPTTLSAGVHEVRVEYYKATGEAAAHVSWSLDQADAPPEPVIDAPSPTPFVCGRAGDRLPRRGDRSRGRPTPAVGPLVDVADPPLHDSDAVPRPRRSALDRNRRRDAKRAGSRLSVASGARAASHRQPRGCADHERDPRPEDSGARSPDRPGRPPAFDRWRERNRTLLAHGDRQLADLPQRAGGPAVEREDLPLRVLVGRGRSDAQHHGACHPAHLHGDICPGADLDRPASGDRRCSTGQTPDDHTGDVGRFARRVRLRMASL